MFSKAAGATHGIAREANVVFVRFPFLTPKKVGEEPEVQLSGAIIIDGLNQVWKDVKRQNVRGKAVLNLSWGEFSLADSSSTID